MSEFVWEPSPERVEQANVVRLWRKLGCESYHELHRVSIEEPERFWPTLIDDLGLEFSTPWERVLDESAGIEWATWFVGGRLNVATNCLHRHAERRPDDVAAVFLGEDGERRRANVRRAVPRDDAARRGAGRARRRARRSGRDLHADVPGGRGGVARVRARRGRAGPDLLGVRGARDRAAAGGVGREGRDLRRRVVPPRPLAADARDGRRRPSRR